MIQLALASSTKTHRYELKTSRPESEQLLSSFRSDRKILLDNPRMRQDGGKPAPDIYLVALQVLNSGVEPGESHILPSECLVFEDSIAGIGTGRRAGMRAVWVPHPDVAVEYQPKHKDILAGRSGSSQVGDDWQLGEIDDGWTESIPSLEEFDYGKYGFNVPS
ncbi:HAD-superfamily hydrolase subfamily IA variant 3 [Penicillium cf. griseofulvum]|uniref:HAD-superfamily hydrolase subfamily IA variant 3 n=1 Tax=Penicillium cf. griseofulvum TaxID=2972120 RepID=A0A9W9J4J1_9EURO|nr:HAD-superfamily hydrolase subfamily IA variant 3 [Penicillium cf. griseofulvum]KAJ5432086.1 HAD-superfamily hydrolase subfamily IA variant 3 [Penicillium cf. griseofulvum]KAJ5435370.1 HAD-superfamily hydrolase subfamily IA variant 3 [Penicillium cf. griseofulvum]KAJ5453202.1 HAD-superfamily hydrolase subfamily IA variant 3 [Penicillium cf. griseofulvum]